MYEATPHDESFLKNIGLTQLKNLLAVDATPPVNDERIPGNVESKYRKRAWFSKVLLSFSFILSCISDQDLITEIESVKKQWTDSEFTKRARLITKVLVYFNESK